MKVEIDDNSGFCFGVINAIESAEKHLKGSEQLYCLGEIVHNNAEVARLEKKGLHTVSHSGLKKLKGKTVLIRAHGEPPSTFELAEKINLHLIDATCPVVLRLQKKIRSSYQNMKEKQGQILIFGKQGHPEVNGLVGQTDGQAIVIGSEDEIRKIDFTRPAAIFAQTTMDKEKYASLCEVILSRMQEHGLQLEVNRTICGSVSNRVPDLKRFSQTHDVIVFVSGRESSNGKVLYQVCKSVNEQTYFISDKKEIKPVWFRHAKNVGICGATSTPRWQMEEVAAFIKKIK